MRLSVLSALMILTTVFLSGCAQDHMAALDDRSGQFYGPNGALARAQATPFMTEPTHQAVAVDEITASEVSTPAVSISPQAPAQPQAMSAIPQKKTLTEPVLTASGGSWQWPVQGRISQRFGAQGQGIANEGITIEAAEGSPIRAATGGEVAYVGAEVRDYGNMVILRHAGGELTSYAHARNIVVNTGDTVQAGAIVGYVGKSGGVTTPQLHFALRTATGTIDPMTRLPQQVASR